MAFTLVEFTYRKVLSGSVLCMQMHGFYQSIHLEIVIDTVEKKEEGYEEDS